MLSNFFDVIFILIFLSFSLWGFFLGFIYSVVFLGIIFIGVLVAKAIHLTFTTYLVAFVGNHNLSAFLSFFFVLFLFIILGKLFKVFFNNYFSFSILSRVAGGLVGFFSGFLFNYTLLYTVSKYIPFLQDDLANSNLALYILKLGQLLIS